MQVLPEELAEYEAFIKAQIEKLGSLTIPEGAVLWHYTTGDGLINIIESGALYSTQVSCLNDSTEARYGSNLVRAAVLELLGEVALSKPEAKEVVAKYAETTAEDPTTPSSVHSYWFVTCFSGKRDDLSQWRAYGGGENGYAIGFYANGLFGTPNSLVVRVNHDGALHRAIAKDVAKAMFDFFRKGLDKRGVDAAAEWASAFFPLFSRLVDRIAPMVKDEAFKSEEEYRIVHQLQDFEFPRVKFRQKPTLMSRHLPLTFVTWPALPIAGVVIGPGRHKAITWVSVDTLLRQKGYFADLISLSGIPFQQT